MISFPKRTSANIRLTVEILKAFSLELGPRHVYLLPRTPITKCHKLDSSKQKFIISQFWRLQGWNRGIGRAPFSLKGLGVEPSLPLPSFWWLPMIPGIPWLIDVSLQFLSLPSHGDLLCICLYLTSFYKNTSHSHLGVGYTMLWYDFIITHYICKELISNYNHIHRLWGLRLQQILLGNTT